MNDADSLYKAIVSECREDHVGLWAIVKDVRRAIPEQDNVFDSTLSLIRRLLVESDVVAGQFRKIGDQKWEFEQWEMPVDKIIGKIGSEWQSLGRDPDISEVVWFTAKQVRHA